MISPKKKHSEKMKLSDKFQQPFTDTRNAGIYGAVIAFNSKTQKKFKKKK